MPLSYALSAVPLLIALNAFFVAAEYAVVAIRPQQISAMRRRGRWASSARAMERLKARPASAIGAIQVCITMTNLLLGWIGEPAMSALLIIAMGQLAEYIPDRLFTAGAFALSFVIVTLLTVVFSELLPKALTLRYVTAAAALTAVPVLVISRLIQPLVWLMNTMANAVTRPLGLGRVDEIESENVTIGELRLMAARAGEQGTLSERVKYLVINSLELADRTGRAIMVPRTKVDFLDLQRPWEENQRIMTARLHSRYPLCDGGIDRVVGIVHTNALLSFDEPKAVDNTALAQTARPPTFLPAGLSLDRLLRALQAQGMEMVVLVDEYGGVEGILTMRDVLDEVVGVVGGASPDGADEHPEPLVVPADLPLHGLARRLNRPGWAAGSGVATVGGLMTATLGHIPRRGEEVEVDHVRLRALASGRKRVRRIEAEALQSAAEDTIA